MTNLVNVSYSEKHTTRLLRLKTRRKLWLEVHLWLGLVAGAVLLIVGLTGSILVFWQEIDAQLNPTWHYVEATPEGSKAYQPLQSLVNAADKTVPEKAKRSLIYYPRDKAVAFWFFYELPTGQEDKSDTLNVFVNPYTGKVIGTRVWAKADSVFSGCLMNFIFQLHYSLLLDWDSGSWIVGFIGIFAFFSLLTGLIVWWPLTHKWKQALSIKPRACTERFNHDLHKTVGIYLSIVMLAVLISGVYFNFGDQFRWLVDRFSVTISLEQIKSDFINHATPIILDEALAKADAAHPEGKLYWFSLPSDTTGTYVFTKHVKFGGVFMGRKQIVVDQYSGQIRHVAEPLAGKAGDVFLQWQWPLHSGQALRMPGRILVLLSGIACAVLFVTGVIRWLQKRNAQRSRKSRQTISLLQQRH